MAFVYLHRGPVDEIGPNHCFFSSEGVSLLKRMNRKQNRFYNRVFSKVQIIFLSFFPFINFLFLFYLSVLFSVFIYLFSVLFIFCFILSFSLSEKKKCYSKIAGHIYAKNFSLQITLEQISFVFVRIIQLVSLVMKLKCKKEPMFWVKGIREHFCCCFTSLLGHWDKLVKGQ